MLNCDFQYCMSDFELQVKLEMQTQLLGIVGVSGSGKSTLLKCLVGLLEPQHGVIKFQHQTLFDSEQQIKVPVHQRNIALIFQNALLFPHMNVLQNLRYAEKLDNTKESKFSFEQIVDLLKADNDILQAVTGQDPFQIGYKTVETLVQSIEGKDVADQGKTVIVEGIPLRRGDTKQLDDFMSDLKSKM